MEEESEVISGLYAMAACDERLGLGTEAKYPWTRSDSDKRWFRELTEGGVLVMGRSVWDAAG